MEAALIALVSLTVLLPAANSQAQDPGLMGLFCDEAGSVNCLDADEVPSFQIFEMYLVLLNPEMS